MIEVMKLEHQLEPRGDATYSAGVLPEVSTSSPHHFYSSSPRHPITRIQGALLSATLRFVEHGHILAEQRQVSARWSRGHE